MKYVLMFTSDPERDAAVDPAAQKEVYERIYTWWAEHEKLGRLVGDGAELQPVHTATTVRAGSGDQRVVTDGPFVEAKEAVGGFAIIDVPDLDTAIAMAKGWPPLALEGQAVEIRPIVDHAG